MLVKKNIVILHPCDKGACAFYRCHALERVTFRNETCQINNFLFDNDSSVTIRCYAGSSAQGRSFSSRTASVFHSSPIFSLISSVSSGLHSMTHLRNVIPFVLLLNFSG